MAINNITGFPGTQTSRSGESTSALGGRGKSDAPQAKTGAAETGDTVSLTDTATKLKALEGALAKQPVVDTANVKAIQKALADGSYELDNRRLAQKLLNFESALNRS